MSKWKYSNILRIRNNILAIFGDILLIIYLDAIMHPHSKLNIYHLKCICCSIHIYYPDIFGIRDVPYPDLRYSLVDGGLSSSPSRKGNAHGFSMEIFATKSMAKRTLGTIVINSDTFIV